MTAVAPVLLAMGEGVTIAVDAIRANRVRAALTILGVAVGVFVVVVIAAAIHGINAGVAKDLEAAGPNSFTVSRFPVSLNQACDGTDETCPWRRNPPLTARELAAVAQLPAVFAAAGEIADQAPASYRAQTLPNALVIGRTPDWMEVAGGDVRTGRNFTREEDQTAANVLLVNESMATALFNQSDPIDKKVSVRGEQFRVIGVYHDAGGFLNQNDQAQAIAPYQAVRRHLHGDASSTRLTIKPRAGVTRDNAIDQVTMKLRELRGLKPATGNDFAIVTQDQLFEMYNKTVGVFFLVMIVLSGIGLIVGGVGVVAIMMISVTERTREIGVRKALGATGRIILWQFLVEAVTLTTTGAVIGLFFGWLVAFALRAATPVPASIPPGAIAAALLASALTGIAFGIYPAARAARLDPVDALRHE